uniref:ATP synthase subunit f, mitochondrial n=1 Tax=Phallusia mammillata TaxID=59560 RepID=A0A6F9D6G0_9ASCI|nr:ATP synthase subunit f, mitochondrial [Phallusia mammillata]
MAERSGLAVHPKYYGAKIDPGMKLPGDTRLLRDVKLYEVPKWLMQRNWTPLGMYFSLKRIKWAVHSKWVRKRNHGGNFYAMLGISLGIFNYLCEYHRLKAERKRKYH